jgi:GNAT superfamily N-acetyltransferase
MEIRPAVPDDAEPSVAMHDQLAPYLVMSAAPLRRRLEGPEKPGRGTFAAVDDGELVGWASTALIAGSDPLDGQLRCLVRPEYRGQGIGTALLELAHQNLKAAGAVSARVFADPQSADWAGRWGYEQTRQVHYAGIDPGQAPPLPPVPDGLRLVPLEELDPRALYEADQVAQRIKPGDATITTAPYDEWVAAVWKSPGMVLDLSVAALDGKRVVSFTLGNGDHHKIWSQMTATMPDQQGRGLAKLVKSAALGLATEAGVVGAYTANYDGNEAMLAVNTWLGYRRLATHSVLICPL